MERDKVVSCPPYLCKRYVRPIISAISQSQLSCNIGRMSVNLFAYTDDMILLSPTWRALQNLINILEKCSERVTSILCNTWAVSLITFHSFSMLDIF